MPEPFTSSVTLDGDTSSGYARWLVRNACGSWPADQVDAAQLLITELVANALEHGGGEVGLRIQASADLLRVEVSDANPAPPHVADPPPSLADERGRGLLVVAALASSWGSQADPATGGKAVWFELRRSR
ncbi:MAG: ATP-binding protein [Nocardioidaceae bacterium]